MRKRLAIMTAIASGVTLATGALPALTADNGTVVATVSAPQPPAPCLTLSAGLVDFGTLAFSDPAATSTPLHDASPAIHITSCSTAPEKILGAASDATFPSGGAWDATGFNDPNTCITGLNSFKPGWTHRNGSGRLYNPNPDGSFAPQSGLSLAAGEGSDVTFHLQMPCRGSTGAGETGTITFYTLAVLS